MPPTNPDPTERDHKFLRFRGYLEGHRDLVSRLITPITHIITLIIHLIKLLTKSP